MLHRREKSYAVNQQDTLLIFNLRSEILNNLTTTMKSNNSNKDFFIVVELPSLEMCLQHNKIIISVDNENIFHQ